MAELSDILQLWRRLRHAGEPAVLATVVKTAGSSYRVPGARLLISKNGEKAGSVSGGCLEDDLLKKAWWFTRDGPVIRRYDTTPEGEIGTTYGLGCNGIIHVLLERLSPERASPLEWIEQVHQLRKPAAICHMLGNAERRLVIHADGAVSHNLPNPSEAALARAMADKAITSDLSQDVVSNVASSGPEVFLETLEPPVRLLIFGAGDDVRPLTRMAALLDWRTRVLDSRAHYARPEKFPYAEEVATRPIGAPLPVPVDAWTVAVLMTHSYSQDLDALRTLAAAPPRYLGILGPRKRTDTLLAEAGLEDSAVRRVIYGPTGLDIGADGAHQVALAVLSEIQAVMNRRSGGSLREARSSIHASAQSDGEGVSVTSVVCA